MKQRYYVFGAHSRGQTFAQYMGKLHPEMELAAYLVDNDEINPDSIDGVPVLRPETLDPDVRKDARVYIGTRGIYHDEITERLKAVGFTDIVPVDYRLDIELRNRYVKQVFEERGEDFIKLDEMALPENDKPVSSVEKSSHDTANIYVVRTAYDMELAGAGLQAYERFIQAGTALTDTRLDGCEIFDDQGEDISDLNKQFCELTALYWLWKNCEDAVIGLEHYRRRFLLPKMWADMRFDVILPVPLYVHPSLQTNYLNRHDPAPWNAMLEYMREHMPHEYPLAKDFFENNGLYSPCNMLIARRGVLDDLCSWLFPVLFAVHDRIGSLDDPYQNRYPGFLSERLISLFFHMHYNDYNVIYSDKNFLG